MADAPRPKPPVPGGRRRLERAGASKPPAPTPTPPAAKPPPATEDNPFLPPGSVGKISQSKISQSKIDAGWGDDAPPSGGTPESFEDSSLLQDAPPSVEMPAAAKASVPKVAAAAPAAAEPAPAPDAKISIPPELRKRSPGKAIAYVLLAGLLIGGAGFAYQSQMKAPPPPPPPPPPPSVEPVASEPLPPPAPTYTAEAPPSASVAPVKSAAAGAPAPAVSVEPAQRAYLDGTALPPGRKIVVDGRVVGVSPRRVQVHCGTHRVQIGDQDPESVDFPCGGGEVTFTE